MTFLFHAIPGFADHLVRQRARKRLREMPDHLLDDIGASRLDLLRSLARGRPSGRIRS